MAKAKSAASIYAKRSSFTPAQLKARHEAGTLRGNERAFVRVGTSTTKILSGEDDLSDWDDEELRRGRRRVNKPGSRFHGKFQGKDPVVVAKALHDELVRRTMDQAAKKLQENLLAAVEVLVEIVTDPEVEAKDRLRAVAMITDRVMGKSPDKVEISGDKPWEIALKGGIVNAGTNKAKEEDDDDDD